MHCREFSSTLAPAYHIPVATLPPSYDNQKCLQTLKMPSGVKIHPFQESWSTEVPLSLVGSAQMLPSLCTIFLPWSAMQICLLHTPGVSSWHAACPRSSHVTSLSFQLSSITWGQYDTGKDVVRTRKSWIEVSSTGPGTIAMQWTLTIMGSEV